MSDENSIRIDKWLWAVRLFKTRSIATEECKKGRVLINDIQVKPSRTLKIDEIVMVRKLPVIYSFRVKRLIEKRVSAKIAVECYENLTSEEEIQKLEVTKDAFFIRREKGAGRPTKKERRLIDKYKDID